MHWGIALGGLVLLGVVLGGVAVADDDLEDLVDDEERDGAPYVDAGLDQEVVLGDEVLLDGGGTWDDQDDITDKEWTIETPDGGTIQPDCPDCWFTRFTPMSTGQYNVTLTVRDAEGHENSDTLYVTVELGTGGAGVVPGEVVGPATNGTSGQADEGCWVAHSTGDGVIDRDICDAHGLAVDFEYNDAGGIETVIFENFGMADEYTDVQYSFDGNLAVDIQTFRDEVAGRWSDYQNNGTSIDFTRWQEGSADTNSKPPSDNTPTGGSAPGGGTTGASGNEDCYAPCGYYS